MGASETVLLKLAKHLYEIFVEELRSNNWKVEHPDFTVLLGEEQNAWIRVAREVCMEADTLKELRKLL